MLFPKMGPGEPKIKTEELEEEELEDGIVESYEIELVNNLSYKLCIVSGFEKLQQDAKQLDMSIRTDQKELKIVKQMANGSKMVAYTKAVCENANEQDYAMAFNRETGKAYIIPINSKHTIALLDHENASSKTESKRNNIFEEGFKMPYPSRNRHNKLVIEMKNNLFKPLQMITKPENAKVFINGLLNPLNRKQLGSFENAAIKRIEASSKANGAIDFHRCHHWKLATVNLSEIRKITIEEFKIEVFLRKAQVASFGEMQALLDAQPDKLLSVLPVIAHLVSGNWVVKSEILYYYDNLKDPESKKNHYKDLIEAREHLIWRFFSKQIVLFEEIYSLYNKTQDHLEIMHRLSKSAYQHPGENVFILEEDTKFLSDYPAIAAKHHKKSESILMKFKNYL